LGTIFNVYKGPPTGAEYEAWREVTCRAFCGVDIQPSEGEAIDCRLRIDPIGALVLAAPSGLSAQFSRTREILGDGCDDLVLVEAQWGRVPLLQGDKVIEMQGGQLCLTDMSVLGSISHGPRGGFRTLRIPRQALLAAAPRAEDHLSIAVSDNDVLRETISGYQTLCASQAPDLDAAGQHLMAQHLVDLVALLFTARANGNASPGEPGRASVQLDLIRADALRDLGNPALALAKPRAPTRAQRTAGAAPVRTIRKYVHRIRARATAAAGPQARHRSHPAASQDIGRCPHVRIFRSLLFQPRLPKALWRFADRDAGGIAADRP
jgi:AraC-binding-like domain